MSDRDKLTPHSKEQTRLKEDNTESKHEDPPPPYPGIPGADITSDTEPLMSPRQPQVTQPQASLLQDQPKFPPHVQTAHFFQPSAPPSDSAPDPNNQSQQLQGPDSIQQNPYSANPTNQSGYNPLSANSAPYPNSHEPIQQKPYTVNPIDHGTFNPLSTNSAPYPNSQGLQSQQSYPIQSKQYPIDDDQNGRYIPLSTNSTPYPNTQGPQLQAPYPIQQTPYSVNPNHQSGVYVPLATSEGYPVYVHQPAVMAPVYGPARRQEDDDCGCCECLGVTLVCCEFMRCLVECCTCLAEVSK